MRKYQSAKSVANELLPDNPLHIYRPQTVTTAVNFFKDNFRGKIVYAVKTNPEPFVLKQINELGVNSFDVASLNEIKTVSTLLPEAELYFMHTVKSRKSIKEAYFSYGVRNFSLDSEQELQKILEETNNAADLNLFVRIAISNSYAELSLADKFGININEAHLLLQKVRKYTKKLGVCFHVGSQCMHPDAYRIAIRMAAKVVLKAKVKIEVLDIGGGFPSIYPGMMPPAMQLYFDAIHQEFARFNKRNNCELICEPGRALVAESGSVIVKVDLRKKDCLYINDGTYGSLFDAGSPKFTFPVKILRAEDSSKRGNFMPFSFFGPTCDSMDFMKGPFYLPEDIKEGDYIEIGQLGAYGRTLATGFNGFKALDEILIVDDEPIMSLYGDMQKISEELETIAA
jgi:ornithine decarboxylase